MDQNNLKSMSWEECRLYILKELGRMNDLLVKMDEKIDNLGIRVAGIAAAVGILVTLIMNIIIRKVNGG